MINAILFDMDGILYDSEQFYIHGMYTWMKELGFQGKEEDIYCVIGTTMDGTYDIVYRLLEGKYSIDEIKRINEEYFEKRNPIQYRDIMFEDIPEGLEILHNMNMKMAVCSSSPRQTVLDSLKAMGIDHYFQFVISGDDIERPKPNPDIYLEAMARLNEAKEDCIVYEDSAMGIAAGVNAGIFTVARKDDRFSQDQSQANLLVNNISELVEWIGKESKHAGSN